MEKKYAEYEMVCTSKSGRLAALKIISGYRTISGGAVYVLAGRKAQPLVSFEDYTSCRNY
uniref:Uncharacterized protein n=1 Tax=Megaselia scalaris TaxID=36166 RepID=T1GKZ8_MEGSC